MVFTLQEYVAGHIPRDERHYQEAHKQVAAGFKHLVQKGINGAVIMTEAGLGKPISVLYSIDEPNDLVTSFLQRYNRESDVPLELLTIVPHTAQSGQHAFRKVDVERFENQGGTVIGVDPRKQIGARSSWRNPVQEIREQLDERIAVLDAAVLSGDPTVVDCTILEYVLRWPIHAARDRLRVEQKKDVFGANDRFDDDVTCYEYGIVTGKRTADPIHEIRAVCDLYEQVLISARSDARRYDDLLDIIAASKDIAKDILVLNRNAI